MNKGTMDVNNLPKTYPTPSRLRFEPRPYSTWVQHGNHSATEPPLFDTKHTQTESFNGLWSGTTRVGWYQKKHSPTHTHPDHQTSFIIFLHLLQYTASSLFSLCAWQSFSTLWSCSWSWTLSFIHHAFLHPIIIFSSQHMPIPSQPVLLCRSVIPILCHLYLIPLSPSY